MIVQSRVWQQTQFGLSLLATTRTEAFITLIDGVSFLGWKVEA